MRIRRLVETLISMLALSCCIASVFFIQFSVVGSDPLSTLTVSLSTLAAFVCGALLTYFLPIKRWEIAAALAVLILIRYLIFYDLVGTRSLVTNVLMGVIFGLGPLSTGTVTTVWPAKTARALVLLGFAGAAGLLSAAWLFLDVPFETLQEWLLFATALLLVVFLALDPQRSSALRPVREVAGKLAGPQRSRLLNLLNLRDEGRLAAAAGLGVLLFCFGVFESYARDNGFVLRESSGSMLAICLVSLALLFVEGRGRSASALVGYVLTVFYMVFIIAAAAALFMGEIPRVLFLVTGVSAIIIHLFIWTHCVDAAVTNRIPAMFTMGIACGAALVAHRLGWLFAMGLKALAGGDEQLASKLAAVALVALAVAAFVAVIALMRHAHAIVTKTGDLPESVVAERATKLCGECGLTKREAEVFLLFCQGRSASYISKELFISEATVKTHIRHFYAKLDVHDRQELLDRILKG